MEISFRSSPLTSAKADFPKSIGGGRITASFTCNRQILLGIDGYMRQYSILQLIFLSKHQILKRFEANRYH